VQLLCSHKAKKVFNGASRHLEYCQNYTSDNPISVQCTIHTTNFVNFSQLGAELRYEEDFQIDDHRHLGFLEFDTSVSLCLKKLVENRSFCQRNIAEKHVPHFVKIGLVLFEKHRSMIAKNQPITSDSPGLSLTLCALHIYLLTYLA